MATPSSPEAPPSGTKLSCTFERQCSFLTVALDMLTTLKEEKEENMFNLCLQKLKGDFPAKIHLKQA